MRFCQQYGVVLWRKTHAVQTDPKQLAPALTKFHSKLLHVCRRGVYQTKDIVNMDQTPLPIVLDNRKTYADKGSSGVWCVSGSGLDKWQCSVQLTIFADGLPPHLSACYILWKRPENYSQKARGLGLQSAGCISTKSLVRWINDEKMDIETMGKYPPPPPQQLAQLEKF